VGNVPLPEPYLLAVAVGVWLDRGRPWLLPGRRSVHHLAGWPLVGAGVCLVGRSWKAASQVDLERPALLVTTGPYAVSRNPMYVGRALLLVAEPPGRCWGRYEFGWHVAATANHYDARRAIVPG
jgi:protein-S-isoprenylcysteine O-methyltransferase Ste14